MTTEDYDIDQQEDPFKKYGGKQLQEKEDPFKKYGGKAISEPLKKKESGVSPQLSGEQLYGYGGQFLPSSQSKSIEDRVRDYVYSQKTSEQIEEDKRQNIINAEIVAIPKKTKAEKLPTENAPIGRAALLGLTSVVSGTLKSIGIAAKRLDFFNEYTDKKAEDLATYKAGQWIDQQIRDLVGDLNPEQKEIFAVKLWQGVGSMGGFLFGGIGSKILKASPTLTTAGLGAATQASAEYEAAIQSGATPEEAAKVFWVNGVIGTTEVLPIMGALRKLDKYSGGVATGVLANKLSSTAAGRITNETIQGFIQEATQEATQQILTNTVAANTYDTTRRIFDGVLESGAIGGIIGSTMTGVISSIREKREAGNLTKEEEIQLAAAEEFAKNKIAEASDPIKNEVTTSTNDNPKVKSILKAKTDIETDLASNASLTDETRASIQSEAEVIGQELEAVKSEVYQQELNGKIAESLKEQIASDKALLKDKTLSEASKSVIQKNIEANQEKLEPIKQFIPSKPKTHVPPPDKTEDETLYENILTNAKGMEADQPLQYFIDKAGEDPVATEEKFGAKITTELLEQVPTDKLKENRNFLAKVNPEMPTVKYLDDVIKERETTPTEQPTVSETKIQEQPIQEIKLKPKQEILYQDLGLIEGEKGMKFTDKISGEEVSVRGKQVKARKRDKILEALKDCLTANAA